MPAQRHRVALGDDRIDVVLTEAPVVSHEGRPRSGHTWLTATPYLVWTPLPYDAPDDGVAFACIGAGDEGALAVKLRQVLRALRVGTRKYGGENERGEEDGSSHAAAFAARLLRVAGCTIQETPMPMR